LSISVVNASTVNAFAERLLSA